MARILFLLFIAFLVYLLFRGFFKSRVKEDKPADAVEDMVQCARCGVNMPRSSAREEEGKLVCLNNPQCKP